MSFLDKLKLLVKGEDKKVNQTMTEENKEQKLEKDEEDIANAKDFTKEEEEELIDLNRKINNESPDGFKYEIISKSYVYHNESYSINLTFSSEKERQETQTKVKTTNDWSSWKAEAGFSGWGVSVEANAGRNISTDHHEGSKTQMMVKAHTVIVTRTSFHEMRRFAVNVRLSENAIRDAKEILKANMPTKQQAIQEFYSKYCTLVYVGRFAAGGWLRTVKTARSTEEMEFAALEKEATKANKISWSAGASAYGGSVEGERNVSQGCQTNKEQIQQNTMTNIAVTVVKESAPGNTNSEDDLEKKIKDARNWSVFPVYDANKSEFIPIYQVIEIQAKETSDKELECVSQIMKTSFTGFPVTHEALNEVAEVSGVILVGDDFLPCNVRQECERVIPNIEMVEAVDAADTYLFLKANYQEPSPQ